MESIEARRFRAMGYFFAGRKKVGETKMASFKPSTVSEERLVAAKF